MKRNLIINLIIIVVVLGVIGAAMGALWTIFTRSRFLRLPV